MLYSNSKHHTLKWYSSVSALDIRSRLIWHFNQKWSIFCCHGSSSTVITPFLYFRMTWALAILDNEMKHISATIYYYWTRRGGSRLYTSQRFQRPARHWALTTELAEVISLLMPEIKHWLIHSAKLVDSNILWANTLLYLLVSSGADKAGGILANKPRNDHLMSDINRRYILARDAAYLSERAMKYISALWCWPCDVDEAYLENQPGDRRPAARREALM